MRRLPGRDRAARHPRYQDGSERNRRGRDDGGQEQAVLSAERGQPGGQEQRSALAHAERGLEHSQPRIPLGARPALDDQQVGYGDGAGEAGPVCQREHQLPRGCGERKQPQRQCRQGRARDRQGAVRAVTVGEGADQRSDERAEVERAHDQADMPDAVAAGRHRQQDRSEAQRRAVHQREGGEPRFDQPQPARSREGRDCAAAD